MYHFWALYVLAAVLGILPAAFVDVFVGQLFFVGIVYVQHILGIFHCSMVDFGAPQARVIHYILGIFNCSYLGIMNASFIVHFWESWTCASRLDIICACSIVGHHMCAAFFFQEHFWHYLCSLLWTSYVRTAYFRHISQFWDPFWASWICAAFLSIIGTCHVY